MGTKIKPKESWALEMLLWRKANLLHRGQFAQLIGVSKRTVHGWDLGEHQPTTAAYNAFCSVRDKYKRRSAQMESPKRIEALRRIHGEPKMEGMGLDYEGD